MTTLPSFARAQSTVLCVGLSYRSAPIGVRERAYPSPDAIAAALARFGCGHASRPAPLAELVVVSTCNRLEMYAAAPCDDVAALRDFFREVTGLPEREVADFAYAHSGADAVRHLCRVAAGLESMVVGEPQILGQVGESWSSATAHGAAGAVLGVLFKSAIRAGRRARAETGINRNPATVSSVAVHLAGEAVEDLADATVVIVGAGEMSELAASALHYRGARDIRVVSRTRDHAALVADRVGGTTLPFERLPEALASADVVITSTSAPHAVISRSMVQTAMACRPDRSLLLLDLALPRDVEPSAADVRNVRCYDLDGLEREVGASLAERAAEVPGAERIVEEETLLCVRALGRLDVAPLITDLRTRAESIRRQAVEKAMRGLAHLSEADRERVEHLTEALMNRLLHEPTTRLKAESGTGRAAEYAAAVRELFALA